MPEIDPANPFASHTLTQMLAALEEMAARNAAENADIHARLIAQRAELEALGERIKKLDMRPCGQLCKGR